MSIDLQCPNCQKTIKAPERYSGKRVKCPGCQHPVDVPAQSQVVHDVPPVAPVSPPTAPVKPRFSKGVVIALVLMFPCLSCCGLGGLVGVGQSVWEATLMDEQRAERVVAKAEAEKIEELLAAMDEAQTQGFADDERGRDKMLVRGRAALLNVLVHEPLVEDVEVHREGPQIRVKIIVVDDWHTGASRLEDVIRFHEFAKSAFYPNTAVRTDIFDVAGVFVGGSGAADKPFEAAY